jgi:hypothetical protein
LVRVLAAAAVFLWLLGIGSVALMLRQLEMRVEMRRVEQESDSLRSEFARLDELEAELARMGQLDDQLKALIGVPSAREADASGQPGNSMGRKGIRTPGLGIEANERSKGQPRIGTDQVR